MDQRIRFCEADGARVAFATVGHGPALICDTGWVGHLEHWWQAGPYRTFIESLAHNRTIVRYDKPGTGLSDRVRADLSVEVEVRALEAVVASLELRSLRASFSKISWVTSSASASCNFHCRHQR